MEYSISVLQEDALKKFLIDIDSLSKLEENQEFNLFDVLKVARTEIRHSNVLAWLFNPEENHGLDKKVLSAFCETIVKSGLVDEDDRTCKFSALNYNDVMVYREWQNIDILIESEKEKFVICIENKIDTHDHSDQLNKYFGIVNNKYDDEFTKLFLYLTPDGLAPRKDDYGLWKCISYKSIIDIIENQIEGSNLKQEIKWFIDSYVTVLRREIMGDTKIVELCQEIYKKHKVALDLIYEHRPDRLQRVAEYFVEWCRHQDSRGTIKFDERKSSKSYCRFRTTEMDDLILPTNAISGWGTENHYFYEISSYLDKYGNVKFCIQLAFSSHNLEKENLEQFERIDKCCKSGAGLRKNWQWRIAFKSKTEIIKFDEELPELNNEKNYIYNKLDKLLKEVLKKENEVIQCMKK